MFSLRLGYFPKPDRVVLLPKHNQTATESCEKNENNKSTKSQNNSPHVDVTYNVVAAHHDHSWSAVVEETLCCDEGNQDGTWVKKRASER